MADETPVIESVAAPEIQAKAEKLGWIPPTRFKGEPERFVDAQEYLDRGEQVLPIVKEHNRRLQGEVEALRSESAATKKALQAATEAIDDLRERHSAETQRAVEAAKTDLKTRLAAASEAGDHAAIAEITGMMIELREANEETPPPPKKKPEEPAPVTIPAFQREWNAENPWYGTDRRRTQLALGIAQELREAGTTLTGRDFLDKVKEELDTMLGDKREPTSKVEGARSSGNGGGSRGSGGKSFSALPAEAKAACDADAKQFVGKGKRYETLDAWRKRYTEIYFEKD